MHAGGKGSGIRNRLEQNATAWQAIPSPRPMKPIPSVVVALTLAASTGRPRSAARLARIALRWRRETRSLGDHRRVHVHRAPTRLRDAIADLTKERAARYAPAYRGSESGNQVPRSPSPAAPSRASHTACRSTSPSEWATMPRSKAICSPRRPRGRLRGRSGARRSPGRSGGSLHPPFGPGGEDNGRPLSRSPGGGDLEVLVTGPPPVAWRRPSPPCRPTLDRLGVVGDRRAAAGGLRERGGEVGDAETSAG